MDGTEFIPHSWPDLIRLVVVAFLGYGANTLPSLLRRKQSAAETRKIDAEVRQIDGTLMIDMMKTAAQAMVDVERLTRKVEFWQAKAETLEAERNLLQNQLDKKIRIGDGN